MSQIQHLFALCRFVAGVILRSHLPSFERMLWRTCRGNILMKQTDIEVPLEDPVTVSAPSDLRTHFILSALNCASFSGLSSSSANVLYSKTLAILLIWRGLFIGWDHHQHISLIIMLVRNTPSLLHILAKTDIWIYWILDILNFFTCSCNWISSLVSAPRAPIAKSAMMSALTIHCKREDERKRTSHLPSFAETKKMKSLTLQTHGYRIRLV